MAPFDEGYLRSREHHLLKTFFEGWRDTQLANGTIVWTSPTGHVYTTEPEGAQWFDLGERSDGKLPGLGDPTGEPTLQPDAPKNPLRCLKMPRRDHTRKEDRTRRITAERATNHARLQHRAEQEATRIADDEPAPF